MHARQDDCIVVLYFVIQRNASLNYISTVSALYKRRNVYINITKSYRVSFNCELYIVGVGDKSPLAIRSESVIETVVLQICQIICSLGGVGRARVTCTGYVHRKSLHRALGTLGQATNKVKTKSSINQPILSMNCPTRTS